MADSSTQPSHPRRSEPISKPAGLHLKKRPRLSHVRGPPPRSVSKNDHDHENPSSCWQRSLNGGHPPRLFSITVRGPLGVVCHERRMSYLRRATVREMKEGPSSSVIRSRSQATASCCGQKPWW